MKIMTTKEKAGYYGGVILKSGMPYWKGVAHTTRSKAVAFVKRWIRESPNILDALQR